jgi:hypothetical protein
MRFTLAGHYLKAPSACKAINNVKYTLTASRPILARGCLGGYLVSGWDTPTTGVRRLGSGGNCVCPGRARPTGPTTVVMVGLVVQHGNRMPLRHGRIDGHSADHNRPASLGKRSGLLNLLKAGLASTAESVTTNVSKGADSAGFLMGVH